jgi:hypothetical protein
MIHRYEDAAFTQDLLLHNINSRGYMDRLCHGFQKQRYPDMPRGVVRSVTAHTLMRADPIYVSDDVMGLWEYASESFQIEKLNRTDLVVPCGFALLPRPFEYHDIYGKMVKYRAIGWLPISQRETFDWDEGAEGQGVWITLLSNVNDVDDYWQEESLAGNGDGHGRTLHEIALERGEEWHLMHGASMLFDIDLAKDVEDHSTGTPTPVPEDKRRQAVSMYAHLQCLWRLMSQLVMTPEPLPRQARRQRQRANRIDTVTVLKLRRYKHKNDHEGEADVHWTHRFIVRGHWRNQWYPSDKTHRQIWVAPYVKGDPDLPLVVKKRGVEFDR